MRIKLLLAPACAVAVLCGAAVLAAPSDGTSARPAAAMTQASYGVEDSIPALRPSILGPMASAGGGQVQLGAFRGEAEAADEWNSKVVQAKDLLGGLTPRIVAVDLPERGRFYRLRVGPVEPVAAGALCQRLRDRGLACIPVRD